MPSLSRQYITCTAKASFSSHRSMSLTVRPSFFSTLGTANTGPMPISSGSQPATAKPRKRPSGLRLLLLGVLLAHHHAGAGAVGELAGVAGGDHAARQRRA